MTDDVPLWRTNTQVDSARTIHFRVRRLIRESRLSSSTTKAWDIVVSRVLLLGARTQFRIAGYCTGKLLSSLMFR
ncbi:hypothetical protein BH683_005380 [Williamsia sp. 1138]|nr:hypothetical protein BH683_005380 [Williamsia sp. 1138]